MPAQKPNEDPLVPPPEAARQIGCRPQTLAAARCTRVGAYASIPYYKTPAGVYYKQSDLSAWLEKTRIVPIAAEA